MQGAEAVALPNTRQIMWSRPSTSTTHGWNGAGRVSLGRQLQKCQASARKVISLSACLCLCLSLACVVSPALATLDFQVPAAAACRLRAQLPDEGQGPALAASCRWAGGVALNSSQHASAQTPLAVSETWLGALEARADYHVEVI